jgi:sulfate adenylyltransferase
MTQNDTKSPSLVEPHGGTLVDRLVPAGERDAFVAHASRLRHTTLDERQLADLELLGNGAFSPLTGFLGEADYRQVVNELRLADGTVWPLPISLSVPEALARELRAGDELALQDASGRIQGTLTVSDVYRVDPLEEARRTYGTEEEAHPGVAYLRARSPWLVGGSVRVLPLIDAPHAELRLEPAELRRRITALGWKTVAGFQTRNPIHRAHEHLTKIALEVADGLVIHPLVGATKGDDVPADVRLRCYQALIERYYPRERTLLAVFPAAMRYAGPREALFHALVRKNYGIDRLIVGRDHAGVGKYYPPLAAQQMFDRFPRSAIGVEPLRFDPTFYCRACGQLASTRTCPHDASERVELSGTAVRERLARGEALPVEFSRPEVAAILARHYAGGDRPLESRAGNGEGHRGAIVWFTGLSGAGKTTLATALASSLKGRGTAVEVLDGDEVRTHLSKGLGFSKEDRDTNIRRIGFVARLLARHGTIAITAAISPYREVRDEVRAQARAEGLRFIEAYAECPIDVLAARDVKGLYRKALAGELANFTGVSDPYEPPSSPEVVVHSDCESVDQGLERLLAALQATA